MPVKKDAIKLVKDTSLIFYTESSGDGKDLDIIIKRDKAESNTIKLSDVFNRIPHGHVIKSETGMGATYLELRSQRNSIIVEPLRITASSKSKELEGSLYIGSPLKKEDIEVTDKMIKSYCNSKANKHKKILVVADSLPRLLRVLGKRMFQDYFLMIDEIDSFQTDSSFREKMENCIDIYKQFPVDKRALVSATSISFSDPVLQEEKRTEIYYDEFKPRKIIIIHTTDVKMSAYYMIVAYLTSFKDDKFMVAFNSIKGCRTLADKLVASNVLSTEDIKIFCSADSEQAVRNYYDLLDESKTLPVKVNFFTSAYFSGFDLADEYHLISISSCKNIIHTLSEKRLKQIAGRCRKELKSETIICDSVPDHPLVNKASSKNVLIKAANKELDALKCIEKNYSANPLLKGNLENIRKLIIKHTTKEGHQFVRKSIYPKVENVISYLNIDAYLENVRVQKTLYMSPKDLYNELKRSMHEVSFFENEFGMEQNIDDKETDTLLRQILVDEAIEIIKNNTPEYLQKLLNGRDTSSLQKTLIKIYLDHYKYIDNEQLLEEIEKSGGYNDSRTLNKFLFAALYESLDDNQLYKATVKKWFPAKSRFTKDELLEKWNSIFALCGLHLRWKSTIKAVRFTRFHFKLIKVQHIFHVKAANPLNVNVKQKRMVIEKDFPHLFKTSLRK